MSSPPNQWAPQAEQQAQGARFGPLLVFEHYEQRALPGRAESCRAVRRLAWPVAALVCPLGLGANAWRNSPTVVG